MKSDPEGRKSCCGSCPVRFFDALVLITLFLSTGSLVKVHFGLAGPSWRFLAAPRGWLAASVCPWVPLGAPAAPWRPLAAPGGSWRPPVCPGAPWRPLAPPGAPWLPLALPGGSSRLAGCLCVPLGAPGCPCCPLAAPGGPWRLLAAPGAPWRSLAAPGACWRPLAAPGASWRLPGTIGWPLSLATSSLALNIRILAAIPKCFL